MSIERLEAVKLLIEEVKEQDYAYMKKINELEREVETLRKEKVYLISELKKAEGAKQVQKEDNLNPWVYNWNLAPDWAQWAATDEDGSFFWYEAEPEMGFREKGANASLGRWYISSLHTDAVYGSEIDLRSQNIGWRESKRRRPSNA